MFQVSDWGRGRREESSWRLKFRLEIQKISAKTIMVDEVCRICQSRSSQNTELNSESSGAGRPSCSFSNRGFQWRFSISIKISTTVLSTTQASVGDWTIFKNHAFGSDNSAETIWIDSISECQRNSLWDPGWKRFTTKLVLCHFF